jgi:hypothetical protein
LVIDVKRTIVAIAATAGLAVPGVADSSVASLPQPQSTGQIRGVQCSVTTFGPQFNLPALGDGNAGWGGGTSCAGAVGTKTLNVVLQILGPDHKTWFQKGGQNFTDANAQRNPVRIVTLVAVSPGHAFRVVATAKDTWHGITNAATVIGETEVSP